MHRFPPPTAVSQGPTSSRQIRPVIFRPVFRLIPAAFILAIATFWSAEKTLPYTGLAVQEVPAEKRAKPAASEGPLEKNNRLFTSSVVKIFQGVQGSESVSIGPDGTQYAGDDRGVMWKLVPGASKPVPFAFVGGRPLGHQVDAAGNLIICDACKGLVELNLKTGQKTILSNTLDIGKPAGNVSEILYANDLDIASDGTIYFSDSGIIPPRRSVNGKWDTYGAFMHIFCHGGSTGRLLAYDPQTRQTRQVAGDIWYANGVTLSEDEDFVLVVETSAFRVLRIWLKGPTAGQQDVFAANLPGAPDGISRAPGGKFWVAMAAQAPPILLTAKHYPALRWLCAWLPPSWLPKPKPYGLVIQLDANGQVAQSLHDPTGKHAYSVSAAHEHDGWLYLGSLMAPYMLKLKL